jgi:hypothetical protein
MTITNPAGLTAAQRLEARRLTPTMKAILRAAGMEPGIGIGLAQRQSARIAARRGFVTLGKDAEGWTTATLTDAGKAVLAMIG